MLMMVERSSSGTKRARRLIMDGQKMPTMASNTQKQHSWILPSSWMEEPDASAAPPHRLISGVRQNGRRARGRAGRRARDRPGGRWKRCACGRGRRGVLASGLG
jgi:hypothetical protein